MNRLLYVLLLLLHFSTIAITHLSSSVLASPIPGGTTGTELPGISGPAATAAFTPVSAESTTIAPNPP